MTSQKNAGKIRSASKRLRGAKHKRLTWAEALLRKPGDEKAQAQYDKYDSLVKELKEERIYMHEAEIVEEILNDVFRLLRLLHAARRKRELTQEEKDLVNLLKSTISMIEDVGYPSQPFIVENDPHDEQRFFICLWRNVGDRRIFAMKTGGAGR